MRQTAGRPRARPAPAAVALRCEADVLEGLESFTREELQGLRGVANVRESPGALRFDYADDLDSLLHLQSVIAVYRTLFFPIPRPKALLGHQHFQALLEAIAQVRSLWPADSFATLRLSAAGEHSAVLTRLKRELAQQTGLRPAEEGDLLLRLRRAGDGWEMLVRLSPRPLATRPWRVANLPGALNATVAHVMMRLTNPHPDDRVLNVACGSGTLLVERLALGPARLVLGCDTDPAALAMARQNLDASGDAARVQLEAWDATALPLPDASVNVICADLPFGQRIGSHEANVVLYPALMAEAARVAAPEACMVLLSHEVRLLEQAAATHAGVWQRKQIVRVRVGGMTPAIYLFRRV